VGAPSFEPIDKDTAMRRLSGRYCELSRQFPLFQSQVTLAQYVRANLKSVMENGLLESYDENKKPADVR
jgi:hypothetical protein